MRLLPEPICNKERCIALLAKASSKSLLRPLHALFETSGLLQSDKFLASELIRAFANSFSDPFIDHARLLLHRLPDPSTACYNHVIRGYARLCPNPRRRDSIRLFIDMRRRIGPSSTPNELTFPFVLNAAAGLGDLNLGRQLHAEALKAGVGDVVYVGNGLIFLYSKCGQLACARQMFDGMPSRSLVSWNSVLSAYAEKSSVDELLRLFSDMRYSQIEPDETSFVVLLSSAAEISNLGLGKWVHGRLIVLPIPMNVQLGTALVDMYAKSGAIHCARKVFARMTNRNVWTWSAMIVGLAQHGLAIEALHLFDAMKMTSIEPNDVTYLGVLAACSHCGLVDDARCFFREMTKDFGIPARMEHYSAMVDVLGRKGHVKEAYAFVKSMPVEPDAVVWRTLLSTCSLHSAADTAGVAGIARQRLLELEPERTSNHVMVANMCAEAGLWEAAAKMRKRMRKRGLKKVPGESSIVVGSSVVSFISGDDTHKSHDQLQQLLHTLCLNARIEACCSLFDDSPFQE
ncbi:pentatricopeptide repeat (PPR) superfamily protein [Wolffia australiana]